MAQVSKKSTKSTVAAVKDLMDLKATANLPEGFQPADINEKIAAAEKEVKAARSEDLMKVTVPAKETDQTLIVPKTVNGKDRWFAKTAIKSFEKQEDGQFVITATRREFAYRGMEELAAAVN